MNRQFTHVPGISYGKLWRLMVEKDIKNKSAFFASLGLSSQTLYSMRSQYNINLTTIDKLCAALDCQPYDIMELVPLNTPEN